MRHLRSLSILIAIGICLTPKTAIAHAPLVFHKPGISGLSKSSELPSFTIYNPQLELQNKIKHDKLVAHDKAVAIARAKEKARLAHIEALRRLAKQRAAEAALRNSQTAAATKSDVQPVYHQPTGCVTGYTVSNYALNQIMMHESGGRSCATNAGGCFGLLQACPGLPLKLACGGNPTCQIVWFIRYKTGGRTWEQVWAYWLVHHYW